MPSPFITALAIASLLLSAGPGHAQYAYANVPRPATASAADREEAPKTAAYKVVHGVVQGKEGALPGATVWLSGTRTVVVTNSEGEFELRVPADAKVVKLTCGFGGLQDEVVTLAPIQAMGSIYLLRPKTTPLPEIAVR